MLETDDTPLNALITDECLCGYAAKVWWKREVMLAFPKAEDRQPILQALDDTMISCGTSTLYYHSEEVDGHFLAFETAETEGVIYVNVRIDQPIVFKVPEVQVL